MNPLYTDYKRLDESAAELLIPYVVQEALDVVRRCDVSGELLFIDKPASHVFEYSDQRLRPRVGCLMLSRAVLRMLFRVVRDSCSDPIVEAYPQIVLLIVQGDEPVIAPKLDGNQNIRATPATGRLDLYRLVSGLHRRIKFLLEMCENVALEFDMGVSRFRIGTTRLFDFEAVHPNHSENKS